MLKPNLEQQYRRMHQLKQAAITPSGKINKSGTARVVGGDPHAATMASLRPPGARAPAARAPAARAPPARVRGAGVRAPGAPASIAKSGAQGSAQGAAAAANARVGGLYGAHGAGRIEFTYSVDAMRNLHEVYKLALESCGGGPTSSPSTSTILFLSQQSARAFLERPVTSAFDMRHDAHVAYLTGEAYLLDHVLREQVRRAAMAAADLISQPEIAVAHRDGLGLDRGTRWLLRPRVGPLGPRCRVQDLNMSVWYDPELIAIRLPDDMFTQRDMFTVIRTCVLVCGSGQVFVAPEGEVLFYDANNFTKPPRQESLRSIGVSTKDVFEDKLRELFASFFSSKAGAQVMPNNQFQIFWVDALTRRVGSKLQPWWIDVNAAMLAPACRSMFVGGESDKYTKRGQKTSVTSKLPLYQIDLGNTASMIRSCVDLLLHPSSAACILEPARLDRPEQKEERVARSRGHTRSRRDPAAGAAASSRSSSDEESGGDRRSSSKKRRSKRQSRRRKEEHRHARDASKRRRTDDGAEGQVER